MKRYLFITLVFITFTANSQSDEIRNIIREGIYLHDEGKYTEAIEKYKRALALDSASSLTHYEIAFSYHGLKDFGQTMHHLDKAIALSDEKLMLQCLILKGSVLDEIGKTDESIFFYEDALRKYPDDYLLLYNYAVSCERLGRIADTEAALKRALVNNPSHPGSNLKLAYLRADEGDKVNAVFGLYFFLLLENSTERAAVALRNLVGLIYGDTRVDSVATDKAGNKTININILVQANDDPRLSAAQLSMALILSASLETNKGKTFDERFVADTETLFKMMGELNDSKSKKEKKKKKKNIEVADADLLWDFYVPYFESLLQAGHTEAFCYHIQRAAKNEAAQKWLVANKEKLEYFYLWARIN
jgi:Tfp pilus assembly protein PilF